MKTKTLKLFLLLAVIVAGGWITRSSAQTTEGDDFWVTFLQGDQDNNNGREMALTLSARENCHVTIEQPHSGFKKEIDIDVNSANKGLETVYLCVVAEKHDPKDRVNEDTVICYSFNSESIDTSAVHVYVEDGKKISLFASNWKSKSFDATNVLPTKALLDEYYIQSYAPSAHADQAQGTHFGIVAVKDSTIVEYTLTANTLDNVKGATIKTPVLNQGDVWYVWTGNGSGDDFDLSGTHVKALNGKPIAVFQGAPHTNIPYQIRDRDQIFSQAMPTAYWGNTFAITSSMTRGRDKIRIMALNDQTEVRINGQVVHTFHFEGDDRNDTIPTGAKQVMSIPADKRTFEFEIGDKNVSCTDSKNKFTLEAPLVEGKSCFIQTNCPVAVHLFMVSNKYDDTDKADPAMVWINPIEQMIEKITFATYRSSNTHYFNVVTTKNNVEHMTIDGEPITGFEPVEGSNDKYYFARQNISHNTHTLEGKEGFIAHVYGYGDKESYAYSAGGATKELKQTVTINGREFTPESDNQLCGVDTVTFACNPDYIYESIKWVFGDGKDTIGTTADIETIKHYYPADGVYNASVTISMSSSNLCQGELATVTIPIRVTIGRMRIENVRTDTMICADNGKFKIWYENPMGAAIDSGTVSFNAKAQTEGFTNTDNLIITDKYFEIIVPETAKAATDGYALDIVLKSDCGNDTTHVPFQVNYRAVANVAQRGNDILAVYNENYNETSSKFSSFQWYRNGEPIEGETNSYINLDGNYDFENEYYVCMTNEQGQTMCSCPTKFVNQGDNISLNPDTTISIKGTYIDAGGSLYVTTKEEGEYTWYDSTGKKINSGTIPAGGCLIAVPDKKGVCLLNIKAETKRSFKVLVK